MGLQGNSDLSYNAKTSFILHLDQLLMNIRTELGLEIDLDIDTETVKMPLSIRINTLQDDIPSDLERYSQIQLSLWSDETIEPYIIDFLKEDILEALNLRDDTQSRRGYLSELDHRSDDLLPSSVGVVRVEQETGWRRIYDRDPSVLHWVLRLKIFNTGK